MDSGDMLFSDLQASRGGFWLAVAKGEYAAPSIERGSGRGESMPRA